MYACECSTSNRIYLLRNVFSLSHSISLTAIRIMFVFAAVDTSKSIHRAYPSPAQNFIRSAFQHYTANIIFLFNVRHLRMMKNGVAVDCRYIGRKFMELKKQRLCNCENALQLVMCPDHRSTLTLSHTKVKPNATRKKVSEMKKKNNSKWYVQLNVRINFHAMNVQRFRRFRTFFSVIRVRMRTQCRMMSLHNLSLPSTACFSNNKYPPSTFFSVCFRSFACWFVLLSLHIRLR